VTLPAAPELGEYRPPNWPPSPDELFRRKPKARPTEQPEEMREFLLIVRRALLLIVRWIEVRYNVS